MGNYKDYIGNKSVFNNAVAGNLNVYQQAEIEALYARVFNRVIRKGCGSCYADALNELYHYMVNNKENFIKIMEQKEPRYTLKRGVVKQIGFSSGDFIVRQNATEQRSIQFLAESENNIIHFEKYPDDWKEDVSKYKASLVKEGKQAEAESKVVDELPQAEELDKSPSAEEIEQGKAQAEAESKVVANLKLLKKDGLEDEQLIVYLTDQKVIGTKKVTKAFAKQLISQIK